MPKFCYLLLAPGANTSNSKGAVTLKLSSWCIKWDDPKNLKNSLGISFSALLFIEKIQKNWWRCFLKYCFWPVVHKRTHCKAAPPPSPHFPSDTTESVFPWCCPRSPPAPIFICHCKGLKVAACACHRYLLFVTLHSQKEACWHFSCSLCIWARSFCFREIKSLFSEWK